MPTPRHAGYLWMGGDQIIERDTYHCCHCQRAVVVQPGSGKKRGYCFRCNEPNCGRPACANRCVPFEKVLELAEARDRFQRSLDVW